MVDKLSTVRELVTRLLHRFEREGWIALSREHIEILNSAALRLLSSAQTPSIIS
jgi:CRP/FNR family transcriptional regulator, anaerobic regulatory protein